MPLSSATGTTVTVRASQITTAGRQTAMRSERSFGRSCSLHGSTT